jgi:acetolactate synthase-1/2/3 large subunit
MGAVGSIGGSRAGNFVLQNSDYILAVGTRLSSQLTGMKKAFAREAYITVIDIDENEHKKNGVPIDKCIKMDAKIFFEALDNYEIKEIDDNWLLKCQHWKEVFSLENEKFIRELKEKGQLDIYSVADIISDKLPDDTVVITDAGFEELIIPSAIRYKEGQRCIFPAAQGAMGYAIPAIIGVHSAGRNNIVCIVGDGSIMMNLQELQTIKSLNIPAKILVINNNMYAVIRKRQKDLFRNRTIGNDSSDGLSSPDFMGIAKCFGFSYRKICNRTDLHEYVKDSFWKSSLEIVEIMCVPDQQYFHESYGVNEKKRIVHRPIEDMAPFLERAVVNEEMIIDSYEG